MTWIKLDDSLPDHDRAVRAGDRAMWLWVTGLCWCSRHLTDGRIPVAIVPRLNGAPDALDLAQVLVDVGLWSKSKKGFVVKNYTTFQRSKEQVVNEREKTADRVKRHREKRAGNGVTNGAETHSERAGSDSDPPNPPVGGELVALSWSGENQAQRQPETEELISFQEWEARKLGAIG